MFELRLALALSRTRAELRRTMTADEFDAWRRFAAVEPFGGHGEDLRLRVGLAAMANVWGAKCTPDDFRFEWVPPDVQQEREESLDVDFETGIRMLLGSVKG